MREALSARRGLVQEGVLAKLGEPIRETPELEASLPDLINSVKTHGLEGLVAKRRGSRYEPGERFGVWHRIRVNKGQSFVIAGHTPSARNFDALVFGYFDGGQLMYTGRTRSGFTPASRDQLFRRFKGLETERCPFANLPEGKGGRWGEGMTAEKMRDCWWLLCRIRHSNHYVGCRTMPHRVLPVLSLLRSASLCFGIIRLSMHPRNRAPFAQVSKRCATRGYSTSYGALGKSRCGPSDRAIRSSTILSASGQSRLPHMLQKLFPVNQAMHDLLLVVRKVNLARPNPLVKTAERGVADSRLFESVCPSEPSSRKTGG